MIPAGYMAKRVVVQPEWLKAPQVRDVYSLSNCVSEDFTDYIHYWKHNGHWLFDSPELIREIASESGASLDGTRLFYYEVHGEEFGDGLWRAFNPEHSFGTLVRVPKEKTLEGFDVATFYCHTSPEHSPLSCNSLAEEVNTNSHCLFTSFGEAKQCLEDGTFKDCEPGPYRIFAVHSVQWP